MYTASYIQDGDKEMQRYREQQKQQMVYGEQRVPSTSAGSGLSNRQTRKAPAVIPSRQSADGESVQRGEDPAQQRRAELVNSATKRAVSLD